MPRSLPSFLALALFSTALIGSDSRAAAGFQVGAEFRIADPVIGPSTALSERQRLGAGPHGFLAVWWDARNQGYRAARINNSGKVLDIFGLPLNQNSRPNIELVFWNGSSYVVVASSGDTRIIRVSEDGRLLDQAWRRIADLPLDMAWNGSRLLIITRDPVRPMHQIQVFDGDGIRLETPNEFPFRRSLRSMASNGRDFLVTWIDTLPNYPADFGLHASLISSRGEIVSDRKPLLAGTGIGGGKVASSGNGYLVSVWNSPSSGFLIPLDNDGNRLAEPIAVPEPGSQPPSFTWAGHSYLFLQSQGQTNDDSRLFTYEVTPEGQVVSSPRQIAGGRGIKSVPQIAWNGVIALAAWITSFIPCCEAISSIDLAVLNSHGERLDSSSQSPGFPVTFSAGWITKAFGAFGSQIFMVAWTERGRLENDTVLYAARLTAAGTPLDGRGLVVESERVWHVSPRVVYAGGNFLVVWAAKEGSTPVLLARRITPGGDLLDPVPARLGTATPQIAFDVASDGSGSLVVWSAPESQGSEIRAARIDSAGNVLDPDGFRISYSPTPPPTGQSKNQLAPSVAFGDHQYVVVWQESVTIGCSRAPLCTPFLRDIVLGARVSRQGTLLDTSSRILSEPGMFSWEPDIAWNGRKWGIAWTTARDRYTPTKQTTGFQVFSGDLQPLSPLTGLDLTFPRLAAEEDRFLVTGEASGSVSLHRLTEDAQLLDSALLAAGSRRPDLVQSSHGSLLLYTRRDPSIGEVEANFGRRIEPHFRKRAVTR